MSKLKVGHRVYAPKDIIPFFEGLEPGEILACAGSHGTATRIENDPALIWVRFDGDSHETGVVYTPDDPATDVIKAPNRD
mgnify:CR=1 FL=1